MTFRNLFIEHDRTPEEEAWVEEETAEQELRFDKIVEEMEALAPQREVWYKEFFDRIMNIGFNTDADDKTKIAPADIPVQPEGKKDQVVWKYGVDGE
ncbi:MAG: hypothetical protein V7711_17190 [Pseudomonadales bacterium]